MTNKYVLTGGPGTGKSTIEKIANDNKIYTIAEVSEWVIELERKKGSDILPWENRDKFQKEVLKTQLEWEREIPKTIETAILDRGIPDGIAYYKLDNLEPPKELMEEAKKADYKKVFLLDMLENYENTKIRKEDRETSEKIHKTIEETYKSLGYRPIRVPVMSPEERLEFILGEIRKE
jgi:predicted ATPase